MSTQEAEPMAGELARLIDAMQRRTLWWVECHGCGVRSSEFPSPPGAAMQLFKVGWRGGTFKHLGPLCPACVKKLIEAGELSPAGGGVRNV